MPIQLVVPMSGQGVRYRAAGYTEPKPLIPVNGEPMISRLLSVFPRQWPTTFIIAENHRKTQLPQTLAVLRPEAKIVSIPEHSRGPGHALLQGLDKLNEKDPVLVSYCDYGMVWDPIQFEKFVRDSACDMCVLSYRGFHPHYLGPTTYAYSRLEGERVLEVREKGSFTSNREGEWASSGGYYFRNVSILREALQYQVEKEIALNGEYYTSLTIEAGLRMNPSLQVRIFEIPAFFQWGTPKDLANFEYWEKSFQAYLRFSSNRPSVAQVLMPMAGLGSRFFEVSTKPKPLIPIANVPMYERALCSLPKSNKTVVVTLPQIASELPENRFEAVVIKNTPAGQALSVREGVGNLDRTREVLVSSCDHAIALNPETWASFEKLGDADAAIFTIRGFPGTIARPQAFAYVKVESSERFPVVQSVSVKKTLSENPAQDPLLVGTFWFKTAGLLDEGIDKLVRKDIRVNGELYLDSVFDVLRESGYRIRMVPLDGYINWGDPDSLAEALYWQEVYGGFRLEPRKRYPGVGV